MTRKILVTLSFPLGIPGAWEKEQPGKSKNLALIGVELKNILSFEGYQTLCSTLVDHAWAFCFVGGRLMFALELGFGKTS